LLEWDCMNPSRKFLFMALAALILLAAFHPSGRSRANLFHRKITGQFTAVSWTEVAFRMLPGALRARVRQIAGPTSSHWVQRLEFPSEPGMAVQAHPIVNGPTATMPMFECHLSILQEGRSPHDIHRHREEELIVPISGEIAIIRGADPEPVSETIGLGQFAYHAANQPHTLRSEGPGPARYFVLKWGKEPRERTEATLISGNFDFRPALLSLSGAAEGFKTALMFEGPTQHLGKLHSHASTLQPGAGYDPHADDYDVAMVLLSGVVETVGYRVEAPSAIFYAAHQPHGIRNTGTVPAQYIVFEFHDQATSE
jgi:mannose-6-phosphate isomerase-like protein (cupin superfamily)